MSMRIFKLPVLPDVFVPNAVYLIPEGATEFKMFVASLDGTSVRHVPSGGDILSQTVIVSATVPDQSVPQMLWWDSGTGSLFVKYNHGNGTDWMEAMPSLTVPDFGGNGTALTVARSDHYHTNITIENPSW